MTVNNLTGDNGVWAVWFAGAKHERAHFSVESIEAAPAPEPKK